ncbi:uncharacterized protein VTP21DRAFT_3105 [Calcarisporiella thermophila]|uniref:uncharacterized protein n=1 Tax=Calcarisporiella thermophila TaxID=911321 RepID=UPI003742F7CB
MMRRPTQVTLFFLLLCSIISAVVGRKLEGHVSAVGGLKENSVRVVLDGGVYSTLTRADGKFVFTNIPEGSYLLEIHSHRHIFPRLRVDVFPDSIQATYKTLDTPWSNRGHVLDYPLNITTKQTAEYFVPRQGFNIASLFSNPLMLMMGFSLIMLFVMPKMLANIDPEMLKELQESQQQSRGPARELPDISQQLASLMEKNRR